jgi:hypothetical protein
MPVIDLRNFAGEVPKLGPSQLDNNQAQLASNCRVVSGELRPLKQLVKVATPSVAPASIFRLTNGQQSKWLSWVNDVDVAVSPIADVSDYRVYYTGASSDGIPRKTNWNLATSNGADLSAGPPAASYFMGVPAPAAAPTLAATGTGTGTAVTRAYVYTYLQTFGTLVEESGPSPAASVNWLSGQNITVSGLSAPPTTGYNITGINIYRTVTGTTAAAYELVASIPVQSTYTDSIADAAIIGTLLPSLTWVPPPVGMKGLLYLGYGILAGFVGNQLYFCEPYKPHAWPVQYMLTFPANIVGLGLAGSQLVVCTDHMPWMVTGTAPTAMTQTPITIMEPCLSKRSIVSNLTGMLYASPNGLVGISSIIQGVITDKLIERDAWQAFNPSTMMGAIYDGRYCGFYTLPYNVPQPDGASTDLGGRGLILDKADEPIRALYTHMDVASFALAPPLTFMNFYATAVYTDRGTGNLYAVNQLDNCIYQLDGDPLNSMTANWKSKRFQFPSPVNMAAVQADALFSNVTAAALASYVAQLQASNAEVWATGVTHGQLGAQMWGGYGVNDSDMTVVPSLTDTRTFQVLVYAGGTLVCTYTPTNNEPIRLPSGFRSDTWEVQIAANIPVRSVTMATSLKELRDAAMGAGQQQQQQGG